MRFLFLKIVAGFLSVMLFCEECDDIVLVVCMGVCVSSCVRGYQVNNIISGWCWCGVVWSVYVSVCLYL